MTLAFLFKSLMEFDDYNPTKETSEGGFSSLLLTVCIISNRRAGVAVRSQLTLSFMSGKQHQIVFDGGRVVRKGELQLELVEGAEAGDGGVSHEGGVAELVAPAEPGTGYIDGCKTKHIHKLGDCMHCIYGLAAVDFALCAGIKRSDSSSASQAAKRWHYCPALQSRGLLEYFLF